MELPFGLVITLVGGLVSLGTAFGYFFALKERISKQEVVIQSLQDKVALLREMNQAVSEKLGHIDNTLVEIKTAFHYFKESKT